MKLTNEQRAEYRRSMAKFWQNEAGSMDATEWAFLAGCAWREQAEAMWIPVSERLPEPGQLVIALFPQQHHLRDSAPRFGKSSEWDCTVRELVSTFGGGRWADEGVTHWMPLPKVPAYQHEHLLYRARALYTALQAARDALHNDFEPDNQSRAWHAATLALILHAEKEK